MKVVILAGGFGTRIQEETQVIPKPMIEIGGKPILWHIMKRYTKYGFKEFIIALGYKSNLIKQYFMNFHVMNSDFEVNLSNGEIKFFDSDMQDIKVTLIDTGLDTKTGGRIKKLSKYICNQKFFLTYGDGLSNINISELLNYHNENNKILTMSVVRPPARFGILETNNSNLITKFEEKPQLNSDWINGGFFVAEPNFLEYCLGDEEMLEKEPIQRVLNINELCAYKHKGFWKCMDNMRDKNDLELMYKRGYHPWLD